MQQLRICAQLLPCTISETCAHDLTSQTSVFQSNQFSISVNLQLTSRYVNDRSDYYFRPVSVGDGLYYSNI